MGDAIRLRLQLLSFTVVVLGGVVKAEAAEVITRQQNSRAISNRAVVNKAADGLAATIVTDGALVFSAPNVDASILAQLPEGRKVRVSKSVVPGGDESFRRIRVGNKIGYITIYDVNIEADEPVQDEPNPRKQQGRKNPRAAKEKAAKDRKKRLNAMKPRRKELMYLTKFVGLLFGSSEFKEGINGVDSSTTFEIYGMKLTGPGVLIDGPVIDFNLILHYGAPSYYNSLAAAKPTGFVLFTDALAILPFTQKTDSMIYGGIGPLLVYSQFNVLNAGRNQDLSQLNLGASFMLGGGLRFDKVATKLEAKYFIEKQSYKQILGSVQMEF